MRRYDRPPLRGITPNLAPLVDVVMVILIFFMLGTSFAASEGLLPTQLPSAGGAGSGPSISPVVRIALSPAAGADQCHIEVAGWTLPSETFDGLHDFLRSKVEAGADPHGRIVIAARPAVKYEFVIAALDACVRAGFKNVQFAVSGESGTGGAAGGRS